VAMRAVQNRLLRATATPEPADAFVIAVPTPFRDHKADMTYVDAAAASIAPVLKSGDLVVLESTSPLGTTEQLAARLAALRLNLLQPGPGVGGHCIAVDPWFIVAAAPAEARLIRTAREVNDGKPAYVLEKIKAAIAGARAAGAKPKVALLGLAFKPDVDDFR